MKVFIKKNDFVISIILIILFSIFIFLPFFIYTPLVQLSLDTFDYSYLAKLIFDGNIPVKDLKIDLPVGYPIIIYIIKRIGLSFNNLVFFQLIFYIFSFTVLCFQLSKFTKFGGLITAITFIFFSFNSHTIRHIFRISPDSFYTSFLILIISGLFFYFRTKKRLSLIVILLSVSGAVLFRSNGVYLVFIFAMIFYDKVRKKDFLKFYVISSLSSLLIISSINYYIKGEFAPVNKTRVLNIVNKLSFSNRLAKNNSSKKVVQKINPDKTMVFYSFFSSFYERHSSYYYSMQKTNYDRISKNKTFSNLDQKNFDGNATLRNTDSSLLYFMFQETIDYSYIEKNVNFQNGESNLWLYSIYVIQEIIYNLRVNLLFYILFWFSMIYWAVLIFSSQKLYFLQIIYLIHVLSLIIISIISGWFVYRYIQVSEFIIYIVTIMFIKELCAQKKIRKID